MSEAYCVFEYMYRGAGNWKTHGALLLSGDAHGIRESLEDCFKTGVRVQFLRGPCSKRGQLHLSSVARNVQKDHGRRVKTRPTKAGRDKACRAMGFASLYPSYGADEARSLNAESFCPSREVPSLSTHPNHLSAGSFQPSAESKRPNAGQHNLTRESLSLNVEAKHLTAKQKSLTDEAASPHPPGSDTQRPLPATLRCQSLRITPPAPVRRRGWTWRTAPTARGGRSSGLRPCRTP
jgi:hypothetical protein